MGLSNSPDNFSSERARLMYSIKNRVNGTEARSLDRRSGFGPANQTILATPQNCPISPPLFYYRLAPTQATKIQVAKLSIIMNWIMSFVILALSRLADKLSREWVYTRRLSRSLDNPWSAWACNIYSTRCRLSGPRLANGSEQIEKKINTMALLLMLCPEGPHLLMMRMASKGRRPR